MKLTGIPLIKWTFKWLPLQKKIEVANWIVKTMTEMRSTTIEGKFTTDDQVHPAKRDGSSAQASSITVR